MLAPAKAAVWRKFESVILPNEDDVGVVTSWNFPTDDVINFTSRECVGSASSQGQDRTVPPLGQHKCASAPPPVPEKLRAEFHQPCPKNIIGVKKNADVPLAGIDAP